MRGSFCWLLMMVMGATAIVARGAGGAATQATDDERWGGTLVKLGSAEFAEREAGQKELAKATWRDRDVLQRLAEKAVDEEVKQRLALRVEALDEELALDPPPISVDLANAPLGTMAQELGKALGLPVQGYASGQLRTSYTLHVVDKPFADVFLALSQQGGFQPDYGGTRLNASATSFRSGVKSGPFLICPMAMNYQRNVGYQDPEGTPPAETLMFTYAIIVDPRVKVMTTMVPRITQVVDEKGGDLMVPPAAAQPVQNRALLLPQRNILAARTGWIYSYSLPLAGGTGAKQIGSLKGEAAFTVRVAHATAEVADMEKQGRTPIQVGNRQLVFTQFQTTGRIISFQASLVQPANGGQRLGNGMADSSVNVVMTDANGQVLFSQEVGGGFSSSMGGQFVGPIKGVFTVSTKTKDVVVPFEFKDLPLP